MGLQEVMSVLFLFGLRLGIKGLVLYDCGMYVLNVLFYLVLLDNYFLSSGIIIY